MCGGGGGGREKGVFEFCVILLVLMESSAVLGFRSSLVPKKRKCIHQKTFCIILRGFPPTPQETSLPPVDGWDAAPLGQRPVSALFIAYRLWATVRLSHIQGWVVSWIPNSVFILGRGSELCRCLVRHCSKHRGDCFSGGTDCHVHAFVADVIESFDTVDRRILDCVLSHLGLPVWFRHAYFEIHARVRLRFVLASGNGEAWTRDWGEGRRGGGRGGKEDLLAKKAFFCEFKCLSSSRF